MNLSLKLLKLICLYVVFVMIFSVAFGYFFSDVPEVIDKNYFVYRLCNGWIVFFQLFPAAQLSGIVIACSLVFGRNSKTNLTRFSPLMFDNFVAVVITALILTSVSFCFQEIGTPLVSRKKIHIIERAEKYKEYFSLATKYTESENFPTALFYVEHALLQNPKSQEAMHLRSELEIHTSEYITKEKTPVDHAVELGATDLTSYLTDEYTVSELMQKARQGFAAQDYFDAHYYATLAVFIAEPYDGSIQEARLLASDAWNKLSDTSLELGESESEKLFRLKREGYSALLNGDWLHAYYIFHDLEKAHGSDPDVERYGRVALEKLNGSYFFIDETLDLQIFENATNVYFVAPRLDGGHDAISIRGITTVKNTGGLVQYLRDFTVYSYDQYDNFERSFTVPYAKMFSQKFEYFDRETQKKIGDFLPTDSVPYVMLKSVDREYESVYNTPSFTFAENSTELPFLQYVLPMKYEDVILIIDATQGESIMPLLSLLQFVYIARQYGYSSEVFGQALVSRICFPLLLLVLSLLAGIIGWNYRIARKRVFKFIWLFILPFIAILSALIFFIINTFQILLTFVLIGALQFNSVPVALVIYIFILIIASVMFLAQRGE